MVLKWNDYAHFILDDSRIFIGNVLNKECQIITKECYKILDDAFLNKLSVEQIINSLETEKEKIYMRELINILLQKRIIGNTDYKKIFLDNLKITWAFTDQCNLHCKHCAISAGEHQKGDDLNREHLLSIAHKLCELNPKSICLTGGEPLVNPFFWEIVEFFKKKFNGQLKLMTNGTLINEENAHKIVENFFTIDISLDGVDEKSCARIRGENVFEKVIKGIRLLQNYGAKQIVVSMVDCKITHGDIKRFKDLCENELRVKSMVRTFDVIGRGEKYKEELGKIVIESPKGLKETSIHETAKKDRGKMIKPDIFGCKAALMEFYVDYRGQIFPCPVLDSKDFMLGNALQEDLTQFIFERNYMKSTGYQYLLQYLPWNLPKCSDCKNHLFCFTCIGDIKKKYENGTIKNCNRKIQLDFV